MAFLTFCPKCNSSTPHYNFKCVLCLSEEYKNSKEAFLITRSNLTTEERLTLIESDIYDLQNKKRKQFILKGTR
jgi:hypothetical protein